jgi:DNA-binding beta-propeller fold protein YncE
MSSKHTHLAVGIAIACLSAVSVRAAGTDVLIGLDEKVSYDANGQVYGPVGKDSVLVMDVSNPDQPKVRASLLLTNSLIGPPTNLQITPDGRFGLVANSLVTVQDGGVWKNQPDDKLFVIDLAATPPKLADTLTVGKQPSGMAISHKGDLALVANRASKSVSVLSIDGAAVKVAGEVPVGNEVVAVAITPDGKRAFAALPTANKVAVLTIDGQTVTYDKSLDIPVAFTPDNVDITPDGKYAVVSTVGLGGGANSDAIVAIDVAGPHPHVADLMTAGNGPEGFAIAPNGKWAVVALLRGSGNKSTDWGYHKTGEAALLSIGGKGDLQVVSRLPLGEIPEAIAFNPDGDYVYIGNFLDQDVQIFHIVDGKLVSAGAALKLPGHPASMRAVAR